MILSFEVIPDAITDLASQLDYLKNEVGAYVYMQNGSRTREMNWASQGVLYFCR